jgi:hypothetical protein
MTWYPGIRKEDFMADRDESGQGGGEAKPTTFHIQIDREHYEVHEATMTGSQLRLVPPTPIPPDRDLFEVVPGHPDRKIENDDVVEIHNGLRFFTAPGTINPGGC